MDGWVKIHRKIFDSPTIKGDPEALAVWLYLITNAAYKPFYTFFGGKKVLINAGELITGRKKIAENTGVSESKIFRLLKRFELEQQIEQQSTAHGSVIAIKNWHIYQESEQPIEQQMNNQRTTDEQLMNTKKEIKEYKEHKEEQETNNNNNIVSGSVDDLSQGMNQKAKQRLEALRERVRR